MTAARPGRSRLHPPVWLHRTSNREDRESKCCIRRLLLSRGGELQKGYATLDFFIRPLLPQSSAQTFARIQALSVGARARRACRRSGDERSRDFRRAADGPARMHQQLTSDSRYANPADGPSFASESWLSVSLLHDTIGDTIPQGPCRVFTAEKPSTLGLLKT